MLLETGTQSKHYVIHQYAHDRIGMIGQAHRDIRHPEFVERSIKGNSIMVMSAIAAVAPCLASIDRPSSATETVSS